MIRKEPPAWRLFLLVERAYDMSWFILAPLNFLCTILCYLTNWIVVLFANEVGDLPGFLKYWQTWDDSIDVEWHIKEEVPEIFRYDFDRHYVSDRMTTEELSRLGRDRGCVRLIDPHFTIKERIQRYVCRTMWLYRNCAYGFAFYVFGRDVKGENVIMRKSIRVDDFFDIRTTDNHGAWGWHIDWPITKHIATKLYIGWKIGDDKYAGTRRAMIAIRIIASKFY